MAIRRSDMPKTTARKGDKDFEKSAADRESKGSREGSKSEEARDRRQAAAKKKDKR